MKTKTSKRILSLFLTVLMIMSSASMIFAYAEPVAEETKVTTPIPYANAKDGDTLWDVNFNSQYYTPVDDTAAANTVMGGTVKSGKTISPQRWRANLIDNADEQVIEEDGAALKIDGGEATAQGSFYKGFINAYTLVSSTYTYEFEYFVKNDGLKGSDDKETGLIDRSKVFYGYTDAGTAGFDSRGITFNASSYQLVWSNSIKTTNTFSKPAYTTKNGEKSTQMKVVLSGSAMTKNSSRTNWTGNVVTVDIAVYAVKEGGDVLVYFDQFVQPSAIGPVFGIGEWNNPSTGEYFGARNLKIRKGDTSNASGWETVSGSTSYKLNFSKAALWPTTAYATPS